MYPLLRRFRYTSIMYLLRGAQSIISVYSFRNTFIQFFHSITSKLFFVYAIRIYVQVRSMHDLILTQLTINPSIRLAY